MDYVRLSRQDEYFLDSDTVAAPTHIGGLEIYRLPAGAGKDFIQKLYAYLRKAPVRAEPFNYKLETVRPEQVRGQSFLGRLGSGTLRGGKPRPFRAWIKLDKVNVDEQIYLHALPRPGGQRELGELVARLHVNRLDRSRPLWEMHLIEGLEGGRYAVYTKLHHSQFDGKRGVELTQYARSTDPAERGLPPVWAVDLNAVRARAAKSPTRKKKTPAPSTLQTLASWGTALQKAGELSVGKPEGGKIAPYSAPASILNGVLTARRRLGTVSLSTERMKAIGAAVPGGATVNEVLLAVCGGALRRYLKDQRALPKRPLIAACPVARVRTDDSAAGNAVGQILVSLGTEVADPRRRLLAVVASSRANKDLMNELDSDTYQNYTQLSMVPQILAAKTAFAHKVLNANLVISNVPGPRETQYVNGARVEAMYATSLLLAGQALNITVSNSGASLDMGILACPDLCPSPQKIAVCAGEEIDILERAMRLEPPALVAGRRRKAASRAKRA
ncbi:MAG: wax ester/triacylglycerol synthase family O-acyltransferase [Proteobacteria bacterium]|nr:wax ester/triacylglycerol synthase family O-acyltransferase [Pseudomonadota bacterium]